MFNINIKWVVIALFVISGGWYLMNLHAKLAVYKSLNDNQSQVINTQSKTIAQLKADSERNRLLTLEISKAESESRSKANEVIKYIPAKVKASDAFNTDAPGNVIDFLREQN